MVKINLFVSISISNYFFISKENGECFSWGWNDYEQLGLGDSDDRNIPQMITLLKEKVIMIVAGGYYSYALTGNF